MPAVIFAVVIGYYYWTGPKVRKPHQQRELGYGKGLSKIT